MKRSRSFDRQLCVQWFKSEHSRRAGALPSAAGLAALSLGLAVAPGSSLAAAIVINSPQVVSQFLGNGDSLDITPTGSITVPADNGVQPLSAGVTTSYINNEGQIDAGFDGVSIYSSSTVGGDISNTGQIDAGLDGVSIFTSTVDGNIANSGTINAGEAGISVWVGSTVTGDITNSGGIAAGNYNGISVSYSSEVQGSIRNEAGGQIDAAYSGIAVYSSGSVVGQDIVNDGIIGSAANVGRDGIELASGSQVGGNVVNNGEIHADGNGINIDLGAVGGGVTNTGLIDAGGGGVVARSSTVAGDIANSGNIAAAGAGIDVKLLSTVGGAISNTGTVTAGGSAISVTGSSVVQGNISNAGTLTGAISVFGTDGGGGGIDLASTGIIDIGQSESSLSGDLDLTGSDLFAITLMDFGTYTDAPMTIMGDALIDGDLMLDFVSGFSVAGGERFTLFDIGGTRSGLFANYGDDALVGQFDGIGLHIDYTVEGDIEFYSERVYVPEPSSLALLGIGALGWAGRRRRG
jgi:hypothetical protein